MHGNLIDFVKHVVDRSERSPVHAYCAIIIKFNDSTKSNENREYLYKQILNKLRPDCIRYLEQSNEDFQNSLKNSDLKEKITLYYLLVETLAKMQCQSFSDLKGDETREVLIDKLDTLLVKTADFCQSDSENYLHMTNFKNMAAQPQEHGRNAPQIDELITIYNMFREKNAMQIVKLYYLCGMKITDEHYSFGSGQKADVELNLIINARFLAHFTDSDVELAKKLTSFSRGHYPSLIDLGTNESGKFSLKPDEYCAQKINNLGCADTIRCSELMEKVVLFSNIRYCHATYIYNRTKEEIYAAHVSPSALLGSHNPNEIEKDTYADIIRFLQENDASDELSVLVVEGRGCSLNGDALIKHIKCLIPNNTISLNYLKLEHGIYGDNEFNIAIKPNSKKLLVTLRYDNLETIELNLADTMQGDGNKYRIKCDQSGKLVLANNFVVVPRLG